MILLLITTLTGICSFNKEYSYEFTNQYGEVIKMWGYGIYAHDSYFKASIFIGTDVTILFFVLPLYIITFVKTLKNQSIENYVSSFGLLSTLFYYSTSMAFCVTYNHLHLIYIALFSLCFFIVFLLLLKLSALGAKEEKVCKFNFTIGMKLFLFITSIALFVAWLPDIINSLINNTSLNLIEVYTTEITYVDDMGIISPLMFITYFLVKKEKFIGYVLLRMILKLCMCIGVILPMQTLFQFLAGISAPIPTLVTKVLIFVVMAVFATYFDNRLKKETKYISETSQI